MSVEKINSVKFSDEVLKSQSLVLVDFYADWCAPCRMLRPTVEAIAEEKSSLKVFCVNIDEESLLAQNYDINSIPCLILFENGKEKARSIGVKDKESIIKDLGIL
ncbi:MAG: thioredoxin [Clostridiales bacterium]|nr:thioredoxin [Clostridiales bacterium]